MDKINVYWTPVINKEGSWNFLYSDPNLVAEDLLVIRNKDKEGSIFACPAASASLNNLYVFKSNLDDEFIFPDNFLETLSGDNRVELHHISSRVGISKPRKTSLIGYQNIEYSMGWVFFAEEPLLAKFTAPYLPTHSPCKGAILSSGEFDIGQWLRPWHLDYFIPNNTKSMTFKENDPLFYVQFKTDKKINLVRFNRTDKINEIMQESVQSPFKYGFRKTLKQRYEMASKAKIKELILSEIRKNIVL